MDDLFQCLLSQTFEEFECILIDDGSTDASGEICDKVACIDKRFEVIHIPNSGVSHARNVGIDASCGEYITFIDADDRIPNNYLENLYERESITYNALKKINPNTILVADPAFGLKTAYAEIPSKFINKNMVGINLSPMVQKEEKISGIIMKNYEILIEHILKETDMAIALIPHVIWDDSDDRIPLMQLYERYKKSGRVLVIEDQNCSKLKYAISKCRFFVGARTHSTIAAYSSGIPTLVVGYSVKARGIARDLFGDEEQYSLSVQRLKETDELLKKFRWILENEELIKKQLNSKIPEVIKRALTAKEYVERLL